MSDVSKGVSDAPQGEGWWKATDGRWYAPELRPSDTPQGPDWWQASNGKWFAPLFHPDNYPPRSDPAPQAQAVATPPSDTPTSSVPVSAPPGQGPTSAGPAPGEAASPAQAVEQPTAAAPSQILESDTPLGPGWWQASNHKWYPPELHPNYHTPAQAPAVPSVPATPQTPPAASAPASAPIPEPALPVAAAGVAAAGTDFFSATPAAAAQPPLGQPVQPAYAAPPQQPQPGFIRKAALTAWEGIWYVIMNIWFGAGYLTKVPAKRAMQDFGLVEMTSWEHFWYIVQCVCFGAGYFAKIPTAKALSELPQFRAAQQAPYGSLAPQVPPTPGYAGFPPGVPGGAPPSLTP
jgi:hypothetical protein